MNWPSFSIVVPTYERRDVVCKSVRSLCALEYPGPLELIVVIDGSKDDTRAALEKIACPFPMRVIYQENTGSAGARNHGAEEAANEVILFLDDDMGCSPDLIVHHAKFIMDGADAVLGRVPLDPRSPPGFLTEGLSDWVNRRFRRLQRDPRLRLVDLIGGHLSVRREVFEQLGGFDQSFTAGGTYGNEDLEFGIRLREKFDIRFNPEAVCHQRYVVTAAQHMRQWYQAGMADVAFTRKYPHVANELFDSQGARRKKTQFLLRPLARLPIVTSIMSKVAVWLASKEQQLPGLPRRLMVRFFYIARGARYWRGVHNAGGMPAK